MLLLCTAYGKHASALNPKGSFNVKYCSSQSPRQHGLALWGGAPSPRCWHCRNRHGFGPRAGLLPPLATRRVVAAHRACNARVFGSVVHGDDTEDSDLDILIDPTPDTTLLDIGAIRQELLQLLGVPVDVLTPNALPEKFRLNVLNEA